MDISSLCRYTLLYDPKQGGQRNEKEVIIAAAIIAVFAAGAALRPQVEDVPAEPDQTAVVAVHTACPPRETLPATPSKAVKLTKQPKPVTRYIPPETPQPTPAPTPTPIPTATPTAPAHSGYGGYVPGFGWIESQGAGQCIQGTQIYENGNKVGIMG